MDSDQDIVCEARNRCGLITLRRPKALNALTYDMIQEMERHYLAWADDPHIYGVVIQSTDPRAFCSGGDLKALYNWKQRGEIDTLLGLYGLEYQHNWTLERFVKPNVSLIDGVVMGGGVGISIYGTHRVVTDKLRFAMPEVGIGFIPDCGASYFLPRLAGETGMYLALTGRSIGHADAYALGLVTHCIPAARFASIRDGMTEAEPVDPMLDSLHADPGPSALMALRPLIDQAFGADSVEEILERLLAVRGEGEAWARETAADIGKKSPTALKVTFRQMRLGASLGLDAALQLEYRIAHRFIVGDEFYEGIRAAVIDKDQRPKWRPASLEAVGEAMIDTYFEPLPAGELSLGDPFAADSLADIFSA